MLSFKEDQFDDLFILFNHFSKIKKKLDQFIGRLLAILSLLKTK